MTDHAISPFEISNVGAQTFQGFGIAIGFLFRQNITCGFVMRTIRFYSFPLATVGPSRNPKVGPPTRRLRVRSIECPKHTEAQRMEVMSGAKGEQPPTVRQTSLAAAAGLRMLDGVRMLGPSLAKLCDMPIADGVEEQPSIASILCIAVHHTTVKNTARTLENLSKAPSRKTLSRDPLSE
jgi:hypothetical protein